MSAKDATKSGKEATMSAKEATVKANDATKSGKDATKIGKDATMSAKEPSEPFLDLLTPASFTRKMRVLSQKRDACGILDLSAVT